MARRCIDVRLSSDEAAVDMCTAVELGLDLAQQLGEVMEKYESESVVRQSLSKAMQYFNDMLCAAQNDGSLKLGMAPQQLGDSVDELAYMVVSAVTELMGSHTALQTQLSTTQQLLKVEEARIADVQTASADMDNARINALELLEQRAYQYHMLLEDTQRQLSEMTKRFRLHQWRASTQRQAFQV